MTAIEMITREIDQSLSITPATKTKSIIIATDGSHAALSAFNAAKLISARNNSPVHVLTVLDLMPGLVPPPDGFLLPPDFDDARKQAQLQIVREQMTSCEVPDDWTMDLKLGRPANTIVDFAHEQDAGLIIIGMNKHGLWGRILGEETALEITRLSDIPLLIASPDMVRLPHRVLVALDLNPDSLQLAADAVKEVAGSNSVSCVHVKPRSEFLGVDWADVDRGYEIALKERFLEMEKSLTKAGLRADLVVLHGETVHELTDFADYCKAELVVAGVRRRRGKAKAIGGRMAAKLIRHVRCSILITPNLVPRENINAKADMTHTLNDSKMWGAALSGFTARNAGRITDLEVDDPEIGSLMEAVRYPLLGVDYDHRDDRLTITLGDLHNVERHLSRTIVHPVNVSILSVDGRDCALSVTHGSGQTLLTF